MAGANNVLIVVVAGEGRAVCVEFAMFDRFVTLPVVQPD